MGRGGSLGDVYKSYQKKQSSIAFSSELEQENNFFAVSAWSAHRQLRVQSDFLEGTAFKPMVSVVYTNATQNTQQTSLHLSTLCCATLCSKFSLLKIFVVKIFSYGLHVYENILTRKIVIFNTKISRFTVISFAIIIFCRLVHLNLVTPACYPTAWHLVTSTYILVNLVTPVTPPLGVRLPLYARWLTWLPLLPHRLVSGYPYMHAG